MTAQLTQIERLALEVVQLRTEVVEIVEEIDLLTLEMQELKDIFRGCACFGTGCEDEKQDADGNLVTQKETRHDTT
jgi:regulator of replication initiation timing